MGSDLEFLKELKTHVELGKTDITHHEMALKMIDDWIDELNNPTDTKFLSCMYDNGDGVLRCSITGNPIGTDTVRRR